MSGCTPLDGWHRVKDALSFAHRWHVADRADGRKWVEADCAIGILVNAANIEEAQPGHAVCVQCLESLKIELHDRMATIARSLVSSKWVAINRSVPPSPWVYDLAASVVKQLPPPKPHA